MNLNHYDKAIINGDIMISGCRSKIKMEQDKAQKEADIRIRNGEVQILQKELDSILLTVKQLETQKGEAQKCLDDLDDKVW
jgi:epidermal growth factor receptor substrate 15